jgi:hypothetical protein
LDSKRSTRLRRIDNLRATASASLIASGVTVYLRTHPPGASSVIGPMSWSREHWRPCTPASLGSLRTPTLLRFPNCGQPPVASSAHDARRAPAASGSSASSLPTPRRPTSTTSTPSSTTMTTLTPRSYATSSPASNGSAPPPGLRLPIRPRRLRPRSGRGRWRPSRLAAQEIALTPMKMALVTAVRRTTSSPKPVATAVLPVSTRVPRLILTLVLSCFGETAATTMVPRDSGTRPTRTCVPGARHPWRGYRGSVGTVTARVPQRERLSRAWMHDTGFHVPDADFHPLHHLLPPRPPGRLPDLQSSADGFTAAVNVAHSLRLVTSWLVSRGLRAKATAARPR